MRPSKRPSIDRAAIDRVIGRNMKHLRKPGVLTVRPGWELKGGQLTGRTAIVATVDKKRGRVPAAARLPDEIGGLPVDVRQATPMKMLRVAAPQAHAAVQAHSWPEHGEREYADERRVSDGKKLPAAKTWAKTYSGKQPTKPTIPYTPPPGGPPLVAVTRNMTILACASPDAGFTVLADFLAATQKSLTVAMYDFTSAKILETLTATLKARRTPFKMVLDRPVGGPPPLPLNNPSANQTHSDSVIALSLWKS